MQHIDLTMMAPNMAWGGFGGCGASAHMMVCRIPPAAGSAHKRRIQAPNLPHPIGIAMRLFFATIAAALAALSGEIVEFQGLDPR